MPAQSWLRLPTKISRAYWRNSEGNLVEVNDGKGPIAWFDRLLEGGLRLPDKADTPLVLLVEGPPGAGKTTLCLELCAHLVAGSPYRSDAATGGVCDLSRCLYVTTDADSRVLCENFASYGDSEYSKIVLPLPAQAPQLTAPGVYVLGRHDLGEAQRLWPLLERLGRLAPAISEASGVTSAPGVVVEEAVRASAHRAQKQSARRLPKLSQQLRALDRRADRLRPGIVVIDNLNVIESADRAAFFDAELTRVWPGTRLFVFVIDGSKGERDHTVWQYASDVVIRMDHTSGPEYYLRTIEVVKARYQRHAWGTHQLKIYGPPEPSSLDGGAGSGRGRAAQAPHPFIRSGGIFIFPSIHYHLSKYKRARHDAAAPAEPGHPSSLSQLAELPRGRCTVFLGPRGGHKSHLGYAQLLKVLREDENASALVISLRDDEVSTAHKLNSILKDDFDVKPVDASSYLKRTETLYFHPGYITAAEFFHRIYLCVQALKRRHSRVVALFNGVDQIQARFPLCAREAMFIPATVELLSGEEATSIFVAVDEKDQPAAQFGLLPLADLIVRFERCRMACKALAALFGPQAGFSKAGSRDTVLLSVDRAATGAKPGNRGVLELFYPNEKDVNLRGLQFKLLSDSDMNQLPRWGAAPGIATPVVVRSSERGGVELIGSTPAESDRNETERTPG